MQGAYIEGLQLTPCRCAQTNIPSIIKIFFRDYKVDKERIHMDSKVISNAYFYFENPQK
jgi:hypothetical protein